jgi:P4 family phage/plasmid primase-like protien
MDRGRPYTAHWFIFHDGAGTMDIWATHRMGGLPRSDVELAASVKAMMDAARAPLAYAAQTSRWLMWDGSGRYAPQKVTFQGEMARVIAGWHRLATDQVWTEAQTQAGSDQLDARQQAAALAMAKAYWAEHREYRKKIWSNAGQNAMIAQLEAAFSVDASDMDKGTGRIVVDDWVIDYAQVLRDGYVIPQPHDPLDLVTNRCGPGVRWEPDARCPVFEQFLRNSVPDDDQRFWLLWRACNALFGRMPRKGFVNLIGETNSGKSTFTDLMAHLGADYARAVPVETFLAKHSGDAGFRQHELMGARFVHTHEPNPGALYDVSFMKTITGRDRMRTAGKYEKPVEWTPQCTPFIGSNGPIRFSTSDNAMMIRQEAVEFVRGYDRMDPFLAERLRAELPGILRLLVGFAEWESRNGVPDLPFSMIELRERMAVATEDALEFVAEWVGERRLTEVGGDFAASRCVQVASLYQWYRSWCDDAGVKPVGRKTFSAVVGRKYPTRQSNGIRFTGLAPA